ncbi:MAG: class I SAM-dependent methyltransferase [Chloroflexi bacterium]|nr:class I SAM-dependent methyltransferase [Chloroflexota bacterium]MCY3939013.1 class I SAM-dependent methyltransferase [Chloroflexota bacterium]
MTVLVSGTPDYTMGFGEEYLQALRRFTAESHARHLLPYLRSGLRVLDFGCGPGAISAGLAKAIAPGELHGVDVKESQVALARKVARAGKHANATFHVADVTDLPFEDGFFDAAHGHSILMHVPDTQAALAEVKRVLKPGGIISCREMICESCFTYPDFGVIRNSWDMFEDLLVADDGHPQMGKQMKGHLVRAGFESIRMSASFSTYSTPEDVAFIYSLANQWFLSPEITEAAIKYGASTEELCNDIRASYDKWKRHPAAFCAIAYGEAIADKPLH